MSECLFIKCHRQASAVSLHLISSTSLGESEASLTDDSVGEPKGPRLAVLVTKSQTL